MATKKSNNSRKALAVALGIMGVAGLSLASAAQLSVTTSTEAAMGVEAFAPCHTSGNDVNVSYDYDNSTFLISDINVSGLDAECENEDIFVSLEDASTSVLTTGSGSVSATGTFTYDATSDSISIETDLGDVTVVVS